jgi:hypothetical protein
LIAPHREFTFAVATRSIEAERPSETLGKQATCGSSSVAERQLLQKRFPLIPLEFNSFL